MDSNMMKTEFFIYQLPSFLYDSLAPKVFKIGQNVEQIIKQMCDEIPAKYRADGRLTLINFVSDIVNLTASRQIGKVERDWFSEMLI